MKKVILSFVAIFVFYSNSFAQYSKEKGNTNTENKGINISNIVNVSGVCFATYKYSVSKTQVQNHFGNTEILRKDANKFLLRRSYITLKKDFNNVFSVRYTSDLSVGKEESDGGNIETRLKYFYLKAKPNLGIEALTGTWIEAGMVHCPWLYYEQNINNYRVQGNMLMLRNKIFTSADFGITIGGNIGPKMDKKFLKEVNKSMKGKWLSYAFGIYNGGGFTRSEKNNNKVFAIRLSARPLANILPELQISGHFNTGKGNSEYSPNFTQFLSFIAYTGKHFILTAQHHFGEGDYKAKYFYADDPSKALKNSGYSFYGEYKIHRTLLAVWGRYDHFTLNNISSSNDKTERIIGGLAYKISKNYRVVLSTERDKKNNVKQYFYELHLEVLL